MCANTINGKGTRQREKTSEWYALEGGAPSWRVEFENNVYAYVRTSSSTGILLAVGTTVLRWSGSTTVPSSYSFEVPTAHISLKCRRGCLKCRFGSEQWRNYKYG